MSIENTKVSAIIESGHDTTSFNNNERIVLCVGMCVLDIIHVCNEFPEEDSDKRYVLFRFYIFYYIKKTDTMKTFYFVINT